MGKIFMIIGPSSSGKDTIFKKVHNDNPDLLPIITYTTRPIRSGEENGKDYFFVTDEDIKEMEENNEIIEKRVYDTIYGPWTYATAATSIDLENKNYLAVNTLDAYESLISYYGKDKIIPLFIKVDDGIRLQRALNREMQQEHPKYTELCRRYLADSIDFSEERLNDLEINEYFENNDLDECVKTVESKIQTELGKIKRRN